LATASTDRRYEKLCLTDKRYKKDRLQFQSVKSIGLGAASRAKEKRQKTFARALGAGLFFIIPGNCDDG
jgi:hypothetical protein